MNAKLRFNNLVFSLHCVFHAMRKPTSLQSEPFVMSQGAALSHLFTPPPPSLCWWFVFPPVREWSNKAIGELNIVLCIYHHHFTCCPECVRMWPTAPIFCQARKSPLSTNKRKKKSDSKSWKVKQVLDLTHVPEPTALRKRMMNRCLTLLFSCGKVS